MATAFSDAGAMVTVPVFTWDEPPGCNSPRGWCLFTPETHPDYMGPYGEAMTRFPGHLCCGFYLEYDPDETRNAPAGRPVLAIVYVHTVIDRCYQRVNLGEQWCATPDDAKEFIAGNVRAYLGLPRT